MEKRKPDRHNPPARIGGRRDEPRRRDNPPKRDMSRSGTSQKKEQKSNIKKQNDRRRESAEAQRHKVENGRNSPRREDSKGERPKEQNRHRNTQRHKGPEVRNRENNNRTRKDREIKQINIGDAPNRRVEKWTETQQRPKEQSRQRIRRQEGTESRSSRREDRKGERP